MTTKILVVGGLHSDEEETASLASLYGYMQQTLPEHDVDCVFLDDIIYDVSPLGLSAKIVSSGSSISDYDVVYIRGPKMRMRSEQAFYLSRFCQANNIRCVNDYSLYYPGTKVAQAMLFFEERAPFLDTIYTLSNETLINVAEQRFGYPYILKTTTGSHGDANHLIRNQDDAKRAITADADVDFLAQQFCQNNRDYRVLVTPTESLIFARKGSAGSHLNNTSKGAVAELAAPGDVPTELVELARSIASRLNLEIAGIDIIPHLTTDKFYFLEVNSQPQFVTGAFLDRKAELIRSLFAG